MLAFYACMLACLQFSMIGGCLVRPLIIGGCLVRPLHVALFKVDSAIVVDAMFVIFWVHHFHCLFMHLSHHTIVPPSIAAREIWEVHGDFVIYENVRADVRDQVVLPHLFLAIAAPHLFSICAAFALSFCFCHRHLFFLAFFG